MKTWLKEKVQKSVKGAGAIVDRKIMRSFAEKFGLVYFGAMSARGDEYELVRGVTLGPSHIDKHLIIGNYKGYDVTILQRNLKLSHPQHQTKQYNWLVLQVDLKKVHLPHCLMTVQHDDRLFFETLQIKLGTMQQIEPQLLPNQEFANIFRVFSSHQQLDALPQVLTEPVMAATSHYFKQFDVEFFEDQIIIFTHQSRINTHTLQEMLREGIWLAQQLDV